MCLLEGGLNVYFFLFPGWCSSRVTVVGGAGRRQAWVEADRYVAWWRRPGITMVIKNIICLFQEMDCVAKASL